MHANALPGRRNDTSNSYEYWYGEQCALDRCGSNDASGVSAVLVRGGSGRLRDVRSKFPRRRRWRVFSELIPGSRTAPLPNNRPERPLAPVGIPLIIAPTSRGVSFAKVRRLPSAPACL